MQASDRQVVVEAQISIVIPGGGTVTDEELDLYSLNDESEIVRMRHCVDTAKQIKAYVLGWQGRQVTSVPRHRLGYYSAGCRVGTR
jgi:hypothetical protein